MNTTAFGREDKVSWINDLATTKMANDLNNDYADDIIQGMEEKDFDTLESALDDLRIRVGVTRAEADEVGKIVTAKLNEKKATGESCTVENEKEEKTDEKIDAKIKKEEEKEIKKEAKGMNPGFRAYLDKKKEEKEGKKPEEKMEKKEMTKEEKKAALTEKKKAWFQGPTEKTKEGPITSNNPETLGYPKEVKYNHTEMAVTAPGGEDSRPWEDKHFNDEAAETKKVMGPAGEEFKEKVKMQRIPEGEKEINAGAKVWLTHFKKAGLTDGASRINQMIWRNELNKTASAPPGFDPALEEKILVLIPHLKKK